MSILMFFGDMSAVESVVSGDDLTILIAQTTLTNSFWENAESVLQIKRPNLLAINTICPATAERQHAASELAKRLTS